VNMKHTRLMLKTPQQNTIKFRRENMKLLVQAVTGHGPFLSHLSKWKNISPICDLCTEEPQTADHLINRCPALSYERHEVSQEEDENIRIIKFMQCKIMKNIIENNFSI
ncbi:Uncharacterized protein FKW44_005788, partial [Caligus rogercresseyi]